MPRGRSISFGLEQERKNERGANTGDAGGCPGDLDGDGLVDGADLTILLADWGLSDSVADLSDDGLVDGADLSALLGDWGPCMDSP